MKRKLRRLITGIVLCAIALFFCPSLDAGELADTVRAGSDWAKFRQLLQKGADVNEGRGVQRTPLHEAAMWGKTDMAKVLIEKGADVNAPDGLGDTPLMTAAGSGQIEMVKLLIQKGADVNARNKDQETALHKAAEYSLRNSEAVALLLQKGADVKAGDKRQMTPLHRAAEKANTEIMGLLLQKGADVNTRDGSQATPLHYAASNQSKEAAAAAAFLIQKGADVNARDKDKRTPLFNAGSKDVAEMLIQKGADVNAAQEGGWTPLFRATAFSNRPEVIEVLIQKGAKINSTNQNRETPLHLAAYYGKIDAAALLIKYGADLNATDKDGQTPAMVAEKRKYPQLAAMLGKAAGSTSQDVNALAKAAKESEYAAELEKSGDLKNLFFRAVASGETEKVDFLIRKGADIKARDKDKRTPLQAAVENLRTKVAALLIEKGGDVNERPINWGAGRTLLHVLADKKDSGEMAALLIEKGADVNARDKFKATPLHDAALKGNTELAEVLIRKGADVNAREHLQQTPLHLAAFLGKAGVAALLIEKGADVNAPAGIDQVTPLHVAACQQNEGQKETVLLLVQKGADVNIRNKEQLTPAVAAERCKHPEIAAIIRNTGGSAGSAAKDLDFLLQKVAGGGGFKFEDDLRDIVRLARSVNPPPAVPQAARDEMTKGKAAFKLARRPEDFGGAVENFKKAASLAPWLPEPYFNLALAQEKFAFAEGRQQNFFEAKRSLGYYLIAAPDSKDAQAVRQKMAELDVVMKRWGDFTEKVDMGIGSYKSGPSGYSEAIRYWKWAIEICPEHPEIGRVYRNIAHVSIDRKDWDEALKYMQKVLEMSPSDPGENNSMGYLLQMRGDLPKACMYYKKACDLGNSTGCKNVTSQCP